jgi:hypothetical protein
MDPLDADPVRQGARRALGDTVRFAKRIDLAASLPDPDVCSSGYALVNRTAGREEILAWLHRGRGWIDLRGISGEMRLEWLDPVQGTTVDGGRIEAGRMRRMAAPWRREAIVLLKV